MNLVMLTGNEKEGKSTLSPLLIARMLFACSRCGKSDTITDWCVLYDEDHPDECCVCFDERVAR